MNWHTEALITFLLAQRMRQNKPISCSWVNIDLIWFLAGYVRPHNGIHWYTFGPANFMRWILHLPPIIWCALIWSIYSSNCICHAVDFNNWNFDEAKIAQTHFVRQRRSESSTHKPIHAQLSFENGRVFVPNVKLNKFKPYKCPRTHPHDGRPKWK